MNAMRGSLGWIEVICGPMFSGKSEELIRRPAPRGDRPPARTDLQARH